MDDERWNAMTVTECRALLARHRVGRVAVVDGDLPMVVPVNFVLDGDEVVFRTGRGSKLDAALQGAGVAFEIDGFDERNRTGWSVLVRGYARQVTDRDERSRLQELPLVPWAPGEKPHYVRIRAAQVTGRRISLPDLPSDSWG